MARNPFAALLERLFAFPPAPPIGESRLREYAVVKDVPPGAPFPYVWVDDDGGARELDADEQRYLRTPFDPTDGGRPYVKSSYGKRTPDRRLRGYLRRDQLPRRVVVRAAGTHGQ